MKTIFSLTLLCILNINFVFSQEKDKKDIEKVIVESYIHGLIDGEDYDKAKEGIHEDFVILGHTDSIITKKTRDEWIAQRSKRMIMLKVKYDIEYIDITGDAASAKITLSRGQILATDYVFLYKFSNGWKIVSAIDHVKRN